MRSGLRIGCVGWLVVLVIGCGAPERKPVLVLSDDSRLKLTSLVADPQDEAKATVVFSPIPEELADLALGDVVISAPVAKLAWNGFMYRVDAMERTGTSLTVHGTQPPLADVIKEGEGSGALTLGATDVDMERTMTEGFGVPLPGAGFGPRPGISIAWPRIDFSDDPSPCTINGHITLPDPQFSYHLEFDGAGVRRTMFSTKVDAEIALDITGRISSPGIGTSITVGRIFFTPIVFFIGPVPVWLQPRIDFKLGVRATVIFDVTRAGFSGGAHLTTGFDRVRGQPDRDLSTARAEGEGHAEGLVQTTLLADLYTRLETGLYLYNMAGPYQYFEQGPRVDVATPRHPFVKVGYRVTMGMGGRLDIIDSTILSLVDFSGAFFDETFDFWSSPNSSPNLSLFTPSAAVVVGADDLVPFAIDGYDVEDGPVTDAMVTWSSSRPNDGTFGSARSIQKRFYSGGPGERQITGAVRDSDGGTTYRTVGVIVTAAQPTITLVDPLGSTYTQSQTPVRALVTSPFYPDGDFCTAPGSVMRWQSSNPADIVSPAGQVGCAGTIKFAANSPTNPSTRTLTFTATDRYNQTWSSQLIVDAFDPPACNVTIVAGGATTTDSSTDNGTDLTAQLTATVATACFAGGYGNFSIVGYPGGVRREYTHPQNQFSMALTPSTLLSDDGFPMVDAANTPQTLDVQFNYVGDTEFVTNLQPFHVFYQYISP